jgi:hypothetical protein
MTAVIKAKVKTQRGTGLGPMDADKNGTLTKAEIDKAADGDFGKIDANHDGYITRQEMATAQGATTTKASAARPAAKPAAKSRR